MYHHVDYNNILHQNFTKNCKMVSTRKIFLPSYYFPNIYLEKYIHDQTVLYHILQYSLSNYDKTIATKCILHICHLTNVDYTEKAQTTYQEIALNSRGTSEFFVSFKMAILWASYIFRMKLPLLLFLEIHHLQCFYLQGTHFYF